MVFNGNTLQRSVRPAPSAEHVQKRKESLCGRCRQSSRKEQKQNGLQKSKGGKQGKREAGLELLLCPRGTTGGRTTAAEAARRGGGGGLRDRGEQLAGSPAWPGFPTRRFTPLGVAFPRPTTICLRRGERRRKRNRARQGSVGRKDWNGPSLHAHARRRRTDGGGVLAVVPDCQ